MLTTDKANFGDSVGFPHELERKLQEISARIVKAEACA